MLNPLLFSPGLTNVFNLHIFSLLDKVCTCFENVLITLTLFAPQRSCSMITNINFRIPISLQPDIVDLRYFKL